MNRQRKMEFPLHFAPLQNPKAYILQTKSKGKVEYVVDSKKHEEETY